jgi:branched-chain amino acid transport system ATP-binding protein
LAEALPGDLPYALRRRLEIARALAADPKLLLLDEALAGLTATELAAMLETLREIHRSGVTLIMIEHVMDATMALCQRIVVLHEGRELAAGTPQEVSHNPAVIDAYLGRAQ